MGWFEGVVCLIECRFESMSPAFWCRVMVGISLNGIIRIAVLGRFDLMRKRVLAVPLRRLIEICASY